MFRLYEPAGSGVKRTALHTTIKAFHSWNRYLLEGMGMARYAIETVQPDVSTLIGVSSELALEQCSQKQILPSLRLGKELD